MTLNEIRQQLKTIRLYYTNKARFSAAFELYVKGLTQEATAEDLNYSTEYIRQKNKKLLLFLQSKLNEREVS